MRCCAKTFSSTLFFSLSLVLNFNLLPLCQTRLKTETYLNNREFESKLSVQQSLFQPVLKLNFLCAKKGKNGTKSRES